jgi:PAS domain S-box-containing protein
VSPEEHSSLARAVTAATAATAGAGQDSLEQSEERFRLLVSQVVDYAIFWLDADGTIASWNAGAERLKGYDADEVIGQHFSMFYPTEDRDAGLPEQLLERARRDGHVEHTGWRVRKDGTRFWGDVVITAIQDEDGELTGFAKVTRDRTERKQLDDARRSFFASITHDLKAPLVAIRGFAGLLMDEHAEEVRRLARRIAGNADRMEAMLDDLAAHARARTAELDLELRPVDLVELVSHAVDLLGPALTDRDVRLPEDPVEVLGDRDVLERIVVNLLGNAVRYSDDDTPIEVGARRDGTDVVLTVRDHGRGIHPDDVEEVFGEFSRGRLASHDGGTGLGLSTARRLARALDGDVWLDSELGVGTTAHVRLPAAGD